MIMPIGSYMDSQNEGQANRSLTEQRGMGERPSGNPRG